MPEAKVRGVILNYEVIGDAGPWIALTPGQRRPYAELVPVSQHLAKRGYRVLLHDRRNCGKSEVGIEPRPSESELWADDLFELSKMLGAHPIFPGGSSAGARLALLFALRHPEVVKGLLLWRVTGGQHAAEKLAQQYYGDYMALAKSGGMKAVCESEHFANCIKARPSNRDRLMNMNPDEFIRIMDTWRDNFIKSANLPVVGATEEQLRALPFSACIIAGDDKVHTPDTARKVAGLIPGSEHHDGVVRRVAPDALLDSWDQDEWFSKNEQIADIFAAFLRKLEQPAARAS
jgi:pimeloyl-ACP methyl ester carboxylesterase